MTNRFLTLGEVDKSEEDIKSIEGYPKEKDRPRVILKSLSGSILFEPNENLAIIKIFACQDIISPHKYLACNFECFMLFMNINSF